MRLGEILIAAGSCNEATITQALDHALSTGLRLGSSLIELNLVESDTIAAALGKQQGVPPAGDGDFDGIDDTVLSLLQAEQAYEHMALPLGIRRSTKELAVVMRDPKDQAAIQALHAATQKAIYPVVASEHRILRALTKHYGPPNDEFSAYEPPLAEPLELADETPLELATEEPLELTLAPENPPDSPAQPLPEAALPEAAIAKSAPEFDLRTFLGTGKGIMAAAVAVLVLFAVAKFAYDWLSDKEIAASGRFELGQVDLSVRFPSTGWIYAPAKDIDESQGPVEVTGAILYRGESVEKPNDFLAIVRISGPLPTTISDTEFDTITQAISAQGKSQVVVSNFAVRDLGCQRSERRTERTAECVGDAIYDGIDYEVTAFMWFERDGSVVIVIFLTQGQYEAFDDEIDDIINSVRITD